MKEDTVVYVVNRQIASESHQCVGLLLTPHILGTV